MNMSNVNERVSYDQILVEIADYMMDDENIKSDEAFETARYVLMDSVGTALLALDYPECAKMLGPWTEGTIVPNGVRVPGTSYREDVVKGAFDIGTLIRWLDYNDTWLAAEWGHPSDNLGSILAVADMVSQQRIRDNKAPLLMKDVLLMSIKAHEIQGILSLQNSLNRVGLDHVFFVKVASTAVAAKLLGATREEMLHALSHAWVDGGSLRTYRHAPNTGSRKSWAAGDAAARGVQLALIALKGEMGYPGALSTKTWGFEDVLLKGNKITLERPLSSYVMENVLFKVSFPAEFHAQTAAEAGVKLHSEVKDRLQEIEEIIIRTHESAIRIIDKRGPLHNPADRDHSLQYITAIALMKGNIVAEDYEDDVASNPFIDELRNKMTVIEEKQYSVDYLDPEKRSIANAVQVVFKDGTKTELVAVEYPLGHRFRREEAYPLIEEKFQHNIATQLSKKQMEQITAVCLDDEKLSEMPVHEWMKLLAK